MKIGRGELWKGKKANGLPLILCREHLQYFIDCLETDKTLISTMLEPLEDIDEMKITNNDLSSELNACQISNCTKDAKYRLTIFRSIKPNEWYKLKPSP